MHVSPDIDCLFLNAGVQRRYDFSQPEKVDLAEFHSEMSVNFSSFVDLSHAFLRTCGLLLIKVALGPILLSFPQLSSLLTLLPKQR